MIYLRTDKDDIIREIVTEGVSPVAEDGGTVYIVEVEGIPEEVIPNLSAYKYTGSQFIRLDETAIKQSYIEDYRQAKINTMSQFCQSMISNGIEYEDGHYSLSTDDQINITRLGVEAQSPSPPPLVYHADGEPVRIYTPQEIIGLFNKANTWVEYNTTYFNLLKQWINEIELVDTILQINYFSALPKKYSDQLEEMVDISQYDDFPITPIIDYNTYDNINPALDATYCIEEYKERQRKEWEERVNNMPEASTK